MARKPSHVVHRLAICAASISSLPNALVISNTCLVIHQAHVEYIANFLRRIYSDSVFGYADYSAAIKTTTNLLDPHLIKEKILNTPFPSDLVKQLIAKNRIELVDIQDWCGFDRDFAQSVLSLRVRKHALVRSGRAYQKSAQFISLLKEMLGEDFPKRPDFIQEEPY